MVRGGGRNRLLGVKTHVSVRSGLTAVVMTGVGCGLRNMRLGGAACRCGNEDFGIKPILRGIRE